MNINEMDKSIRFMFITTLQCALAIKEMGGDKETFMTWCTEIWNSIELNDPEKLRKALNDQMEDDISKAMENYVRID